MKKSKGKKKVVKSGHKNEEKPAAPIKPDEANENPFDFGGLPDRDLKKNLGCG